jgi:RNA polymerase sigma-70 factor (ECF subfamily)
MKLEVNEHPDAAIDAGRLFRQHASFVAHFLRRGGAPPSEVPDLVQEVFLVAHSRGGFTPGPARASSWLAAIAMRVAANARRKRRRPQRGDGQIEGVVLQPLPATSPRVRAEGKEEFRRFRRALHCLPPRKRTVFVLYELDGKSCEEIAKMLAVPVGTVHSRLHSARARFRAAYETEESLRPLAMRDSLSQVEDVAEMAV